jgi:glycosyltransferase involved in cell wall biosynthesis
VLHELDGFDVVHSHLDYFGFPLARQACVPVVTTLHGRLDLPELEPVFREFVEVPLVSISHSQRKPVAWANFVATVPHGIDVHEFTFNPRRGDYLAFLGRISVDKGVDTAIRVARKAGLPLKIAARMPLPFRDDPSVCADWQYWEREIQPLLGSDIEVVGEVGGAERDALLGNAAALLFPIRWPEPFGLVMIEALACGTPVLALCEGSVPEVIRDGVTGYIRKTEDGLVEAVSRICAIDRQSCRREAECRFSPAAMAEGYERVFSRLVWARSAPMTFDLGRAAASDGQDLTSEAARAIVA